MNTTKTVKLLPYTITLRDGRTGEVTTDTIVLDKDAVRLCQGYGMDGPALLHRIYNAQGYRVLDVTGHRCRSVSVDLMELYQRTTEDTTGNHFLSSLTKGVSTSETPFIGRSALHFSDCPLL